MDPVRINEEHEQCTADGDRREHGYSDTKAEREGKPLHRRTAQEEEDAGGDDDSHIRIKDGDKCTFEAGLDSQPKHLAGCDLFFESFKDEDIRIDRHTDGQNDARHTWKCQCRMQHIQDAQKDEDIHKKCHIRDKAGHTVHGQHENNDQRETDGESHDGLILRVLSKRRTDGTDFHDGNLDRKRTASEKDRKILRFFERSLPRDDSGAAGDGFINDRIRQELSVEIDADMTADIRRSEGAEFLSPLIGKFQSNERLLVLPHLFFGVFQVFPRQLDIAFLILELEDCGLANGFDGLLRILFTRQLDDDTVRPFTLDDRFRQTHFIDTLLHDIDDLRDRLIGDLIFFGILSLHDDMRAALQVKALTDMPGQPAYARKENPDNGRDNDPESDERTASDAAVPFLFQNFNLFS